MIKFKLCKCMLQHTFNTKITLKSTQMKRKKLALNTKAVIFLLFPQSLANELAVFYTRKCGRKRDWTLLCSGGDDDKSSTVVCALRRINKYSDLKLRIKNSFLYLVHRWAPELYLWWQKFVCPTTWLRWLRPWASSNFFRWSLSVVWQWCFT